MSSAFYIFAERWVDGAWALVGEPAFCELSGCMRPPVWLELNGRDDLMTVFSGRLASFSGLDHTGLESIAGLRGLPDDLSPVLRTWAEMHFREEWAAEPSWLKAREVLEFDWHGRNLLHRGYVSANLAHHFDPEHPEAPFPYDAWPGGEYEVATNPMALDGLTGEEYVISTWQRPGSVEVHWSESHLEVLGNPTSLLTDLHELGPPDEVRLIFWLEV